MPFLSGSLPTIHRAEVLQAEVVLAVHHDCPGGRQTELGRAVCGGRGLLLVAIFFGLFHLVFHAILDLESVNGRLDDFFMKIDEVGL